LDQLHQPDDAGPSREQAELLLEQRGRNSEPLKARLGADAVVHEHEGSSGRAPGLANRPRDPSAPERRRRATDEQLLVHGRPSPGALNSTSIASMRASVE